MVDSQRCDKVILDQNSTTLVAASFGVGGILLGHYLTRSWQREQWRLDLRREEYRELISALSTVFADLQRFGTGTGDREFGIKRAQLQADSYRVIRDRIFIADEIAEAMILERWYAILGPVEDYQPGRWKPFVEGYTEINRKLVQMALSKPPTRLDRAFRGVAGLIGRAMFWRWKSS